MKRKNVIILGIIAIILVVIIIGVIIAKLNKNDSSNTGLKVDLNSKQYVNSLEKINIGNTNDSIIITENVKWDVPDYGEGVTASFSIAIPYTITVDGKDYNGIYELGDSAWNTDDNNPKYNFKVTNLTKEGKIEILITSK